MLSATSSTSFMLCEISTTAEAAVGEAAYQAEDLRGLGDAEGGGRLVEDDHLGVPQHRLGDGHGLALAAGEAGDPLADRLHGAHRQGLQGLLGGAAPCCSRRAPRR